MTHKPLNDNTEVCQQKTIIHWETERGGSGWEGRWEGTEKK